MKEEEGLGEEDGDNQNTEVGAGGHKYCAFCLMESGFKNMNLHLRMCLSPAMYP